MSNYKFKKTIKFVLFSNEEVGQKGSESYVQDAVKGSKNIEAAINLNMIAYGEITEDIDIVTWPKHRWLAEYISSIASFYSDFKIRKVIEKSCFREDEMSLWKEGYEKVLIIEHFPTKNPHRK